jgi:hypothetical protein
VAHFPARGDTVVDVLKVGVILLVVLLVLLGLPLGMPMTGASMCPECASLGTWGLICVALVAAFVLLLRSHSTGIPHVRALRPSPVAVGGIERPPRTF